ncbi:3-oxo-tetronate kinase [Enterovirga rhinocerotis]|uniref:3-oxo-tetronate kinase n=1 Tax=Enterovirga rhinocerotis TaxID=1339210 RepID=A0A4R7BWU5_9HYPH|nr:3-oxo-tetronate kinase [Enterovirga rhinocerotis]TDR89155.1 uncharacterized protein YgbK (DUF1537 family) [Enterovirga rhinocerotis]
MELGVIADDFTGASDIANTIAKGGLSTVQFLGLPDRPAPASCQAGVVALKSRSIPAGDAIAQSLQALDWLKEQGCRQVVFKYCSTFDSTPAGNIGQVGEALAERLGVKGVVACPAFPTTGRTIYQGHLFVGDRLLNESGMESHPLNPMTDSDLRRFLRLQTADPVGLVPWSVVRRGGAAIRKALDDAAAQGETLVIVDAVSDDDLYAIGEALDGVPLLTGGSGIALGLARNILKGGTATAGSGSFAPVSGDEMILAGSCSNATRGQVERHAARHPTLRIDVGAVMDGRLGPEDILAFAREHRGKAPLAYSSSTPAEVKAAQERHGREAVAETLDRLFAEAARRLVEGGLRRLVVAGGETSGAVVGALGLRSLAIGPEIDPGVPALSSTEKPLALALKSGNFGAPDFFEKALATLEGA